MLPFADSFVITSTGSVYKRASLIEISAFAIVFSSLFSSASL